MRLSGIVQPAYLALVSVQEFSYDKISEHCRSAVCLVHKLVAAHLDHGFGTCVAAYGVPVREREECLKHLKLGRSTLQHVESHTYGALAVIFGRKRHIGLGLCRVSVLALESRRQGSIHHVANRRQIVVGHPSPQLKLHGIDHGSVVHHGRYVLNIEVGLVVVCPHHQPHVCLALAKRHEHPYALPHASGKTVGHGVGEQAVERQRKYDICVSHLLCKNTELCPNAQKMKVLVCTKTING